MSALGSWHWSRWLRAGIAVAFIAQGYASSDGLAYAIGAFFGIQAIFNLGCFGAGACAPATHRGNDNNDITYQEIR